MPQAGQWYDSLMGGSFSSFEVEADNGGATVQFYPEAHAYECERARCVRPALRGVVGARPAWGLCALR